MKDNIDIDDVIDFGEEEETPTEVVEEKVVEDTPPPYTPPPVVPPVVDEDDDPYRARIVKEVEEKFNARLDAERQAMYQQLAPVISRATADHVRAQVNIPQEAEGYLNEIINEMGASIPTNLTKKDAQYLADIAVGRAHRENKLTVKSVTPVSPVNSRAGNLTQTQRDAAQVYFEVTGKKMAIEEVMKY